MQDYDVNVSFISNSLTRRTIVQVIYRNHYSFCDDIKFFLEEDEFFSSNIKNRDLFVIVLEKVFSIENKYEDIFKLLNFEFDLKSPVAIAILKSFIAELLLQSVDYNILFKEYLSSLNAFCPFEAADMKIVLNKCVETNFISSCFDLINDSVEINSSAE